MRKGRMKVVVFVFLGLIGMPLSAWGAEVEVGQVVVTATKTEVEVSEVPQSVTVITREEILRAPDRTVGEIIHRVAGVEISQNGPRGSLAIPRIRGSEPAQVLVLLDGRRINDAQLALYDLNSLPVAKEEIERIEVLRGGASALYGTDAMGGVIHIITKRASKTPSTYVSASLGRFDTQEYALSHRWKPGAFGYGLTITREASDGYRPNSDYENLILGGELSYEPAPHSEIRFAARSIRKEIGTPNTIQFPDPDDRQKDNNVLLDLSYQGKWTPELNLSFKGFQNIYRMTFDPGSRGTFSFGPPFLHKNYATGGDLLASYAWGTRHLLSGGTEVIQDRVNSSSIGIHRATRGAFYLQDEVEIAKPVSATVGFRYDLHSIYEEQFNPRVGLLFRLPAEVRIRTSVARAFRAPTFNDLFWPDDGFTVGNPNLTPERAWSYEVGGERKFGDLFTIKAAGFYRRVKDLIVWQFDSDIFKYTPRNINSAKIWGAEAELTFYPAKNLAIPLNYSFVYPRDEGTGGPIPFRPKHIFNAGVDYTTSFGLKGSLRGRYVQYYLNQNTTFNRDSFVLDAKVAYGFKVYQMFQGEAFVGLTNALNRDYQITEGFPMPPRSLHGGASFNF